MLARKLGLSTEEVEKDLWPGHIFWSREAVDMV